MSPNEKVVTDEKDERELELEKKTDRTDEEAKELDELKNNKQGRYQKRINELTWKAKSSGEELERERAERERLQEELERLKAEKEDPSPKKPAISKETVDIGGKKFYTDEALASMIKAGEITEDAAYKYQRTRDKEEAVTEAVTRIKQEENSKRFQDEQSKDLESVKTKYPHFSKAHPDFNPEDPLYKKANELFANGLYSKPDGLSKAIEYAKQILRINDTPIDRTEDLNLDASGAPDKKRSGKREEVELTENEKEAATRMWGRGDVINPKTGNPYTEREALAKALDAKKRRIS